jgi:hypothetical protein
MRNLISPKCVDVVPDYAHKVINITVRLAFFKREGDDRHFVAVSQEHVDYMVTMMQAYWSERYFNCFKIVLKIEARSVVPPPLSSQTELCVELQTGREISRVAIDPDKPDIKTLSDDPKTRLEPVQPFEPTAAEKARGFEGVSIWRDNPGSEGVWAHELGHVMGLGDGYLYKDLLAKLPVKRVKPGHTRDLMADSSLSVSSQMITRLIRRSDKVDESQIKCPLHFKARGGSLWLFFGAFNDIEIDAMTTDYTPPSDDRINQGSIDFTGNMSYTVGYLMDDYNAEFRQFLGGLGGFDPTPLAKASKVNTPITFTLTQTKPSDKKDMFPVLRPPSPKFTINFGPNLNVEARYHWEPVAGFPVLDGPMSLNGMSTSGFYPGPPLWGYFYFEDKGGTK